MSPPHSRQLSFASSFVSTSANSHPNSSGFVSKKRTPVKIGPWKLGKTLGKGATGRVFLATNVDNNQKAAVKIVSKASLTNDQSKDSDEQDCDSAGLSYGIEREIIIMKLLNHKNVLRLYDVWETEKALYLVLEYVEGGELFDLLVDSGPLPENTAVDFFKQIILGAAYCHSLGICHRDLKPENILLDKDLNVKIADFGMAALESGRLLETSCGSPHYAAPEIVSGLHYHGAESDVWSCGVILFALLTGRLPFDDDNIRDLLLKVQVGEYEIVEDLSDEAKDLIHQMLTVEPQKRIKTRDILKHPLIKKYYDCEKDAAFTQLPSPESAVCPVKSKQQIDKRILENLVILWHGRSSESIIEALLSPNPNSEKTFYTLLLRYRHDHAMANKNNNNNNNSNSSNNINSFSTNTNFNNGNDLVRSSSVISKTTEHVSISNSSSSSNTASNASKRKSLSITASTPNRRPVSFQRNNKNSKSRDSLQTTDFSSNNITPLSNSSSHKIILTSTAESNNCPSNNRDSQVKIFNDNSNINRRSSLIALDTTPTKRKSRISSDTSNLKKMLSNNNNNNNNNMNISNPKSQVKRNSVTSKVLSSYATMAAYDKKMKSPDDYAKRTSSDFATLCDTLFNSDDSKMESKFPTSESITTLNAMVFGNDRRSKRYSTISSKRLSRETKPKKKLNSPTTAVPKRESNNRTSSNPIERISKLLNPSDFNNFERRTASDVHANFGNLSEPPKPISRLDPRYRAYESYQKRTSQHAAELLKLKEEAEEEAKALAEIKEREEKLKKEQEELERLKKSRKSRAAVDMVDQTFHNDNMGLSSGTVLKKDSGEIMTYPQPKKSQLKSNRYSTLSMYSTKASSKRLSFYLRELDDEITKNVEKTKKDRISRLSLLVSDPDFIVPENDAEPELNFDLHNKSMNTLKEADEENSEVSTQGKVRSASVSNVLDDDLFFVNESALKSNISTTIDNRPDSVIPEKEHLPKTEETVNATDITVGSSIYEPIPALPPKIENDDTTVFDSENIKQNGPKLPNIPGSPIKEKVSPAKSHNTFEIFEDAIRKSRQEFDDLESKITATSAHKTEAQLKPKSTVKSVLSPQQQKQQPKSQPQENIEKLNVDKQRQPLGAKDTNQQSSNPTRKTSAFLSKIQQFQPNTERKSSFGKTFKSLFSGGSSLSPPESINTVLAVDDSFDAMKTLLVGWKHYGIGNLSIDSSRHIIKGEIAKNNNLSVKFCRFSCVITSNSNSESKITFNHEKGSEKSYNRLVGEVKRILTNENVISI
ncbi:hypothetical protein C6P40_004913 [Pichia californica]|uniref:non-specific serine/threonine protein kinase n=1 Tax=Pichia californica TaxID=460514 RepID=A0A9P6WNS3_9ASCO|nr:hypothetical protein C6P42_004325 [[Candida] californica]KAG0689497.1 hypothetical protein C6P40_004913 [[Candida] californica]